WRAAPVAARVAVPAPGPVAAPAAVPVPVRAVAPAVLRGVVRAAAPRVGPVLAPPAQRQAPRSQHAAGRRRACRPPAHSLRTCRPPAWRPRAYRRADARA